MCRRRLSAIVAALVTATLPVFADQNDRSDELTAILARIGGRVEQYFARAQSIICDERVHIRTLGYNFSPTDIARELVYELRVAWDAAVDAAQPPEAVVLRQIRTINGRKPRTAEDPGCMDPHAVSPEPLSMLLAGRRDRYLFRPAGTGREGARAAVILDFQPRAREREAVTFRDDCVSVSLPGQTVGRVWADVETGDVLRLDEHLVGMFEFTVPAPHRRPNGPSSMAIERAQSSIRYRPVTFQNPNEALMLPGSIETLTFWRGAPTPRVSTVQTFSNCRRFLTDGRIVEP